MNILERFPIDTIRRFVANRLGVNPRELSMDYRCLTMDASSIIPDGTSVYGTKARAIVPIAFTVRSTAVQSGNQIEIALRIDNHTCGDMVCYSERMTLVNVAVERVDDVIVYENLCNPFGMLNPHQTSIASSSCFYSVLSDFCIFEGQLTPYITLLSSENIPHSLTTCKFEYLEFGLS